MLAGVRILSLAGAAGLAVTCLLPLPARAGDLIAAACKITGGPGAPGEVCACMQIVADFSLSPSDQKFAAYFLRNPRHANQIRRSNPQRRGDFWRKFDIFALTAERHCVGLARPHAAR